MAESAPSFDAQTWKTLPAAHKPPFVRRELADQLIADRMIEGYSKAQVAELLGPADESPYFAEYDLTYWLGPERSFIATDSEWLVIRFDDSGNVSEYQLKTD